MGDVKSFKDAQLKKAAKEHMGSNDYDMALLRQSLHRHIYYTNTITYIDTNGNKQERIVTSRTSAVDLESVIPADVLFESMNIGYQVIVSEDKKEITKDEYQKLTGNYDELPF